MTSRHYLKLGVCLSHKLHLKEEHIIRGNCVNKIKKSEIKVANDNLSRIQNRGGERHGDDGEQSDSRHYDRSAWHYFSHQMPLFC